MSHVRAAVLPPSDMGPWLERASGLMFGSLAVQRPSVSNVHEMRQLLPALPEVLRPAAEAILAMPLEEWEPEFFSVLGPTGCPACESDYDHRGADPPSPLLADVAAFYAAFAYEPEPPREAPDHAAVELDFLSFVAVKVAYARLAGLEAEADTAMSAYQLFQRTHLEDWIEALCTALIDTGSTQFREIAHFLQGLVALADPPHGGAA